MLRVILVYCPQCGSENQDDSNFCGSCGENLEKEAIYKKNTKYINYGIYFLAPLFIGMFIISSKLGLDLGMVLIILIIVSGLVMYKLYRSGKPQTSKYCPICESTNFNEHFCMNCGYNLDDVLGYFKTDKYDIEMNKKHINIYEKYRYQGKYSANRPGVHSHGRHDPKTFTLDKIRNLGIFSCKTTFSHNPCLRFDYLDNECKIHFAHKEEDKCIVNVLINRKIEKELNKTISLGIFDNIRSKNK